MKLVSVSNGGPLGHVGILLGQDEVLLVQNALGILSINSPLSGTLKGVLQQGDQGMSALHELLAVVDDSEPTELREAGAIIPMVDANLLPVIPDPTHIISCGQMYHQHVKEMGDLPTPKYPGSFLSSPASLAGHNTPIILPDHHSSMVDYEGELVVIIGKTCHRVDVDEAMDYVVGYTMGNDVSARDWAPEVFGATEKMEIIEAWGRNINGKQFPGFNPIGPALVTCDEIEDPHNLELSLSINDEVMQQVNTSDLIFSIAEIVSYFSQWYSFQSGDLIFTGTPGGVGLARNPPVFLKDGDCVEVSIAGLGTLKNIVRSA